MTVNKNDPGVEALDGRSPSTSHTPPIGPSPSHSPEDVVRAQIHALTADRSGDDGQQSVGAVDSTDDFASTPGRDGATADDSGNSVEFDEQNESTATHERGNAAGIVDTEDSTAIDDGVRALFDFASAKFRTRHGSLEAFSRALSTPIYRRLLEAESVERGPLEREENRATQTVLATHPDGHRTYEFVLVEQPSGKYEDCWMTDAITLVYDGVSPSFRRMPTVRFGEVELKCDDGDRLRDVLLRASGYSPHNDVAQVANCGGNGLCGTCAVEVDGDVSDQKSRERARLELPPHEEDSGLRLSCQTRVHGDVDVTKHDGVWGQHVQNQVDTDGESTEPIPVSDAEYDGTFDYQLSETAVER